MKYFVKQSRQRSVGLDEKIYISFFSFLPSLIIFFSLRSNLLTTVDRVKTMGVVQTWLYSFCRLLGECAHRLCEAREQEKHYQTSFVFFSP